MLHRLLFALIALGLTLPALDSPAEARRSKKKPEAAADATSGDPSKKKEKKAFAEVVTEMEKTEGLFTFWRDAESEKVLLELLPDQLEKATKRRSGVKDGP